MKFCQALRSKDRPSSTFMLKFLMLGGMICVDATIPDSAEGSTARSRSFVSTRRCQYRSFLLRRVPSLKMLA